MASKVEVPLSLVIKAVDQATGPIREAFKKLGESKLAERFKGVGHAFKEVRNELGVMAVEVFEVFQTGKELFEFLIKGPAEAAAALAVNAKRVGLTVDAYAQLRFAAGQAHISQDSFTASMDKFNQGLGQAKAGTGRLLAFLKHASPVFAQQVLHAKNNQEALLLMAKAFEKVKDPASRAALAQKAFGDPQFGQFLAMGAKGIEELEKRYGDLAGSQKEFAEGGEEFEKGLNETSTALEGLRNTVAAELFPALTPLLTELATWLASNREGLQKWARETARAISDWVKDGGLQRLIGHFRDAATTVRDVVDHLGGFKGILVAVGTIAVAPLITSVVSLTAAFARLGLALGATALSMGVFGIAAVAVGAAAYEIWKNWGPLKEYFSDLFEGIWKDMSTFVERLRKAARLAGGFAGIIKHPFSAAFTFGKSFTEDSLAATNAEQFKGLTPDRIATIQRQRSETKVVVDFNNVPKGTRVSTTKRSDADVDLNVGPAWVVP